MNKENRNVVMITDDNQIRYLLFIFSIIKTKSPNISLYLIGDNLSKESIDIVERFISKYGNINFENIDPSKIDDGLESKINHISRATFIRLLISDLLPDLDNCLYLDNDIYIDGDINEAFDFIEEHGINNNYAAEWSEENEWYKEINKLSKYKEVVNYFNAGVFHFNLKEIRENKIIDKFYEFYFENKEKITMADQDILNAVLEIKPLPHFYNIAKDEWKKNFDNLREKSNLKIIHFLSTAKPWNSEIDIYNDIFNPSVKGTLPKDDCDRQLFYRNEWRLNYYLFSKEISLHEKTNNSISIICTLHDLGEESIYSLVYLKSLFGDNVQAIISSYKDKVNELNEKYSKIFDFAICENGDMKNKKVSAAIEYIKNDYTFIFDPDDDFNVPNIQKILSYDIGNFDIIISNYYIWHESTNKVMREAAKVREKAEGIFDIQNGNIISHEHPLHNASSVYKSDVLKKAKATIEEYDKLEFQDIFIFLSVWKESNRNVGFNYYGHLYYKKYDITNSNTYSLDRKYFTRAFLENYIEAFNIIENWEKSEFYKIALTFIIQDITNALDHLWKEEGYLTDVKTHLIICKIKNLLKLPNTFSGSHSFTTDNLGVMPRGIVRYNWKPNSNLSVGTTFYKESIVEIIKYYERVKNLSNDVEFICVIDRKIKEEDYENLVQNIPYVKVIRKGDNFGKFDSIYKIAKTSKCKYIKIADPDDLLEIDIETYKRMNVELESFDEPLLLHTFTLVNNEKEKVIKLFESTGRFGVDEVRDISPKVLPFNANYIFNTKTFLEKTDNIPHFTAHSDLYLISLLTYEMSNIAFIDFNIYKYYYGIGISSVGDAEKFNKDKERVYNHYIGRINGFPKIFQQALLHYNYHGFLFGNWKKEHIHRSKEMVESILKKNIVELNSDLDKINWEIKRVSFEIE